MSHNHTNNNQPYFITTAIPYINGDPHIGHALEFILTDALARYHRLKGEDVRFLTGADENSLKNVQAAEQAGLSTRTLVDQNAAKYYALRNSLGLSFDDFIRTSVDPRHLTGVEKLWRACDQNGDVYRRAYRGLYCTGCEQFYADSELLDGLCPEHQTRPEPIEEENYFFRLSRYANPLIELIESDRLRIVPETRKNEVLSFIKAGLLDFSISRSRARARNWGIPVPGDSEQVIYVWFDALSNYITALDYAGETRLYQRYWLDNPRRIHVIGKGITRFHAIYWPAMLLSAGVPLPTTIFIHGYITLEGTKVSKSLGNVIDPVDLAETYGTDALRYYLLREVKATEDGDFTLERFIRTYNADLAGQLGNLLSRFAGMVERYYQGVVPAPGPAEGVDCDLIRVAGQLPQRVDTALAAFAPHEALAAIWELVGAANKYIAEVQPWVLAKQRGQNPQAETRLATALYNVAEALRLTAYLCAPFLPATAQRINRQLGLAPEVQGDWKKLSQWGQYPPQTEVRPGEVLFPKLDVPDGQCGTAKTCRMY